MIYKIDKCEDPFIQEKISESVKELEEFYETKLDEEPNVVILDNRKMIDDFYGRKTEPWLVAWAKPIIFILNRANFEKESDHSYSDEIYKALLKHEISHIYFDKLSERKYYLPAWIWFLEGVPIYSSGQLKLKKRPTKFNNFLDCKNKGPKVVYQESGFVIDLLIKQKSKENLLGFIKSLKNIKTEEEFNVNFLKTFGFELNYDNLNKLI